MLRAALLIIDLQEDFLPPKGALAVPNGRDVISNITELLDLSKYPWLAVALTQDWHAPNHTLFASLHNSEPFREMTFEHPLGEKNAYTGEVKTKMQTLWPSHCIQESFGASIEESIFSAYNNLPLNLPTKIIRKGYLQDREYYLCFSDVWKLHKTELEDFLLLNNISHLVLVGLAYDYCVLHSSIDGALSGFPTAVLRNCCKSVYPEKVKETELMYHEACVQLYDSIAEYMADLT